MEPSERFLARTSFRINPMRKVCELIKEWETNDCETEKRFEEALLKYLENNLPGIEIIKQYGLATNKVDIAVDRKVFIEIKKDLKNTNQLKRLIGQLRLYAREDIHRLIILIFGQYENYLINQLNNEIYDLNSDLFKSIGVKIILKK